MLYRVVPCSFANNGHWKTEMVNKINGQGPTPGRRLALVHSAAVLFVSLEQLPFYVHKEA